MEGAEVIIQVIETGNVIMEISATGTRTTDPEVTIAIAVITVTTAVIEITDLNLHLEEMPIKVETTIEMFVYNG